VRPKAAFAQRRSMEDASARTVNPAAESIMLGSKKARIEPKRSSRCRRSAAVPHWQVCPIAQLPFDDPGVNRVRDLPDEHPALITANSLGRGAPLLARRKTRKLHPPYP
jgi:hypothetical protein